MAYGVDVAHSGHFPSEELVPPLRRRWRVEAKGGTVLAADGRVYVAGTEVYALDQRDGHRLWTVSLEGATYGRAYGAAYDGGIVFVSTFDDLHAYNAETGAEMWHRHFTDAAFAGAPVASGGVVYAGFGQGGGTVSAYRASDGQPIWSRNTVGGADAPALGNRFLFMAGACGNAQAINRASGEVLWTHSTGCSGGGSVTPALFDGRLYSPTEEYVDGNYQDPPVLEAASGNLVGRFTGSRPVFVDGLAVYTTSESARAVDLASGREAWARKKPLGAAMAIGHDLYGTRANNLGRRSVVALDPESGEEVWSARVTGPDASSSESPVELGAAPGLLIAADGSRVTAYESALKPPPGGIALGSSAFDVPVKGAFSLVGVLGTDLRGSRPEVAVAGADWPGHRFRQFSKARPARDGGFGAGVRIDRNSRLRVSAGGARSNVVTVYTYLRAHLGRPVGTRRRAVLKVSVAAPRARFGGHRLTLYLQRHGQRRLVRLGTGRLRATGRGRGRASIAYRPPRHATRRDLIWHCVSGQLRMGIGRPSPLTRRCGARVLRHP